MTFQEAAAYTLHFGKYRGRTLDDVASEDEGLRYLDWLAGLSDLHVETADAVRSYLADASIQRELERVLG